MISGSDTEEGDSTISNKIDIVDNNQGTNGQKKVALPTDNKLSGGDDVQRFNSSFNLTPNADVYSFQPIGSNKQNMILKTSLIRQRSRVSAGNVGNGKRK